MELSETASIPPTASNTKAASATSPVEREVGRIRGLLQSRRYSEALRAAESLRVDVPENRDVLYLIAVSQRFLQKNAQSLATLAALEQLHPGFSRLYQERGHCYVAQRDAPAAIEAFLRAVNINPALPRSWSMLEGLYRLTGDTNNAAVAAAHVATLKKLPPEILVATGLFSDGNLAPAESMVRGYLLKFGDHVEGMRLLARIGIEREVLDDAEFLLEEVLTRAPDYRAARYDYARVLLERHKHLRAQQEVESLLKLDPENRQYRTLYATICVGLGDHKKGLKLYRGLLTHHAPAAAAPGDANAAAPLAIAPNIVGPGSADLQLSLAHCLKTLGRQEEAIEAYHAAAAARSSFGDAYWSLANLKTYRFAARELARMREDEAAPMTTPTDRYHLCFALGKALEDAGEYAESFLFYERGNSLKKAASSYRPEPVERNSRLQIKICTREFFSHRAGVGAASAAPIFIVGLPRAGSTLIEQILASHSKVEGTQELADIPRIVMDLQGRDPDMSNPRYPAVLAEMPAEDFQRLGEKYIDDTRVYRTDKAHFIDKMPNNFRHIGLIHLMLPNAKIIDARREPMACCFSNFKQLFAAGQEFTYSIEDIARYYRTYLELMGHWDDVLPGRVLRVEHAAVVDDLEGNVRKILDFCKLGFEPACLAFHETARSVRTASSEQVRRPIFRDGLSQWKKYEPWLGPLADLLGDARLRYR